MSTNESPVPASAPPRLVQRLRELRAITGGSTSCGWMYDETALLLYALTKYHRPDIVVQTGHLWGKSALFVLEALSDGVLMAPLEGSEQNSDRVFSQYTASNRPAGTTPDRFFSVDPQPLGVPDWRAGIRYLEERYPNFQFRQKTSGDFFRSDAPHVLKGAKRLFGIVDGDHSFRGYVEDLEHLHSAGARCIFIDDTSWIPHLRKEAKLFAAHRGGYLLQDFAVYNGVSIVYRPERPAPSPNPISRSTSLEAFVYRFGGLAAVNFCLKAMRVVRGRIG